MELETVVLKKEEPKSLFEKLDMKALQGRREYRG